MDFPIKLKKELFEVLKHGDQEHQEWLEQAINNYFDNTPIPPVKGGSNKGKVIQKMRNIVFGTDDKLGMIECLDPYYRDVWNEDIAELEKMKGYGN